MEETKFDKRKQTKKLHNTLLYLIFTLTIGLLSGVHLLLTKVVHEVKQIVRPLKSYAGLAYHESKLLVSRIQVHKNLLSIIRQISFIVQNGSRGQKDRTT